MNSCAGPKGAILVMTTWILAILAVLALGLGFRLSIEARLCRYNADGLKALYLAKAGLCKTEAMLSRKSLADIHPDSKRECGYKLSDGGGTSLESPKDIFVDVPLGEGSFTVGGLNGPGPSDEESRLNVNVVDEATLVRLLDNCVPEGAAETFSSEAKRQIAASIVAWRKDGPNASEDNYYASLPHPYERKKAEFSAIEELLLVRGMTPALFRLIEAYVTLYGDKLNINTASEKVFLAAGLTPNLVAQILAYRRGPDGIEGTPDDQVFSDENIELALSGAVSTEENALLGAFKSLFITRSRYFRIESTGKVTKSKIRKQIVCVVRKEEGKWPTLLSYREY